MFSCPLGPSLEDEYIFRHEVTYIFKFRVKKDDNGTAYQGGDIVGVFQDDLWDKQAKLLNINYENGEFDFTIVNNKEHTQILHNFCFNKFSKKELHTDIFRSKLNITVDPLSFRCDKFTFLPSSPIDYASTDTNIHTDGSCPEQSHWIDYPFWTFWILLFMFCCSGPAVVYVQTR